MRVVSYYPDALLGEFGTASAVRAWCAALAGCGVDVRLVADAGRLAVPAPNGVELVPVAHSGHGRLRRPRSLSGALNGADLLVLHGAGSLANVAAGRAADAAGKPYLVTGHGAFDPQALARRRVRKAVWNALLERRHLRRALAVHLYFADEQTGLPGLGVLVPVLTAPNGCTVNGRRWAGGDDVVWLGRFDVQTKGLDLLLEAMRRLPADERPRLRLIGPDWRGGKRRVAQRVARLELEGCVTVEEPVYGEDKWSVLSGAAGLVHPSRWDACPTTVMEAASIGLPILTTPHPLGRFLASRGAAVLVDAGPDELAAGLRSLRSPTAAEVGARAAAVALEDLAWPRVAGSWLRQVDELLGRAA